MTLASKAKQQQQNNQQQQRQQEDEDDEEEIDVNKNYMDYFGYREDRDNIETYIYVFLL